MKFITDIVNKFSAPDSQTMAKRELEQARKAFLAAQTHTEYYTAQVDFESKRIKRLEEYLVEVDGKKKTK